MKMRKNIHKVGTFVLSLLIMLAVLSPLHLKAADELAFLVDEAGLLSAEEAADIESKLSGLAQKYDMHYVIVTSEDPNISSPMAEADDFFDYNGYGTGENRSGVLLYINMETRDIWISTRGFGITAFTDAGIDYILDELADGLGSELYYDTFETYIARCDDFTLQAKNGTPYDVDHMPEEPFPVIGGLIMCMALGAVVALPAGAPEGEYLRWRWRRIYHTRLFLRGNPWRRRTEVLIDKSRNKKTAIPMLFCIRIAVFH